MNRRGFFRGLVAAPVAFVAAPLARLIPAPAAPVVATRLVGFGEIVTATLRNQSAKLAANVMKSNALLREIMKRAA